MLIDVEERLARQYHFEVTDHRLTFLGICQDCQRKTSDQGSERRCHQQLK